MIKTLITKKDTFEIVRDQISALLKLEIDAQKTLATMAGENPANWDLRVFQERSNPFEEFSSDGASTTPIVNVWYDSSDFPDSGSNSVDNQKAFATFNVDCFTCGESQETAMGHDPGDLVSALDVHRAIRLARNILMAGENTYLQLRGIVWSRKVMGINVFQPDANDASAKNIMGARLIFRVEFMETSPQIEPIILETLAVQVKRAETGEILLETEYNYNGN